MMDREEVKNGVIGLGLLIIVLFFFFLAMREVSEPSRYRYTDDSGCQHYDEGKMERIECGGKK